MSGLSKHYIIAILTLTVLCGHPLNAQRDGRRTEAPPFAERLFYGGSFGLQFGTVTNLEVSPVAGFWLLPRLAVAAGPKYQYFRNQYTNTDIYGGRTYMRFYFINDISQFIPLGMKLGFYVQGEYEALSLRSDFWLGYSGRSRFWEHTGLAGLGISQGLGMRSSVNISFLWAVTPDEYEIYGNPEIRFDFIF